jgi:hypothetical protein
MRDLVTMSESFLSRLLRARIAALPEAQKLYASYAFCEGISDREIMRLLRWTDEDLAALRSATTEALADLVPVTSREAGRVRHAVEAALRETLAEISGETLDRAGRLPTDQHIVVDTVSDCARRVALEDVSSGDGSELRKPKDPTLNPRFHSARSSCALAVNAFAYWRCDTTSLVMDGAGGYEQLRFEAKFPIRRSGRRIHPNVDVHATGPSRSVAVESKLLEYVSVAKPISIAAEYDDAIQELADVTWRGQIERLRRNPCEFRWFAAGQIVKHYLGLKSAGTKNTQLCYVFWEPLDAAEHRVFAQHRLEFTEFAEQLADPDVAFAPLSYASLLAEWEQLGAPIAKHVDRLRARYDVSTLGAMIDTEQGLFRSSRRVGEPNRYVGS